MDRTSSIGWIAPPSASTAASTDARSRGRPSRAASASRDPDRRRRHGPQRDPHVPPRVRPAPRRRDHDLGDRLRPPRARPSGTAARGRPRAGSGPGPAARPGCAAVRRYAGQNSAAGTSRSPAAPPTTRTASSASSTGSVSPAGEAFITLPPIVPRCWICAAPIVAAASTSAGRCSRQIGERRMSVYVRERAELHGVAADRDPAQLVEPPQVDDALRRRAQLAGELDHQVRAAGDRAVRLLGEQLVRLAQRVRRHHRRLDRHQAAPRSAASRIASMILV